VSLAFAIDDDPARVVANRDYAARARVEVDGKPRFMNDQHCAVITRGASTRVDLVLDAAGGESWPRCAAGAAGRTASSMPVGWASASAFQVSSVWSVDEAGQQMSGSRQFGLARVMITSGPDRSGAGYCPLATMDLRTPRHAQP
jgi:hypothetical protein